jgi:acetolactate synthase-1/2/3 large subunit
MAAIRGHGGELLAETLRAHGIDVVFTLIGGHIFPMLDGAAKRGLKIVDVRDEAAATFAAEAYGKLARAPGAALLDAGPSTINALNGVVSAHFHGSPMFVAGGRFPEALRGRGPLQEIDHAPILAPVTKMAETVADPASIPARVAAALGVASARHRGPVYLQFPLDGLFAPVEADVPTPARAAAGSLQGSPDDAVRALAQAERPVVLLGSDVWADRAQTNARAMIERLGVPAFMNGMGRGTLPADHALAFSAARGRAFKEADLVVVIGTPLDFRLGFGRFGDARVVHVADHVSQVGMHAEPFTWMAGSLAAACDALAEAATPARDRSDWLATVRAHEEQQRAAHDTDLRSNASPIHPSRVYGELVPRLARDAVVIADGGDFASYAGKYVDVYEQGGWLDPGPYGCLGLSAGYALAAGTLYPGRQIVVLLGDGAAGFSLTDWDTLVRFGIDVTFVCGNNAGWGLEKGPMRKLYDSDVATNLRPETRYDEVMRAFGGDGEMVRQAGDIGAAIERALATQGPSLVNVITDPDAMYPRSGM